MTCPTAQDKSVRPTGSGPVQEEEAAGEGGRTRPLSPRQQPDACPCGCVGSSPRSFEADYHHIPVSADKETEAQGHSAGEIPGLKPQPRALHSSCLAYCTKSAVLKVGPLDQQYQHPWKCTFSGPTPNGLNQKLWGHSAFQQSQVRGPLLYVPFTSESESVAAAESGFKSWPHH